MRIIATLAYTDHLNIHDLASLLRPAYIGSQKVKEPEGWDISTEEDAELIERSVELRRSPLWAVVTRCIVRPPVQVPNENTIGPIAFLSLLTRMAKQDLLDQAQTWDQVPPGTDSSVTLAQLKQMTSPQIVKKMLTISTKRVATKIQEGILSVQSGVDPHASRAAFLPAAELSAAAVVFDETTNGKWSASTRGTRRKLVMSLGEVAEMSLRAKEYGSALGFALEACSRWQSAPSSEAIPRSTLDKNKRRVPEARRRINANGSS